MRAQRAQGPPQIKCPDSRTPSPDRQDPPLQKHGGTSPSVVTISATTHTEDSREGWVRSGVEMKGARLTLFIKTTISSSFLSPGDHREGLAWPSALTVVAGPVGREKPHSGFRDRTGQRTIVWLSEALVK